MPSNVLDDVLFSAVAARSRALDAASNQTVFFTEVVESILEAVDDGTFTVTVAEGAATSGTIQWVIEQLRLSGYGVTTSTTNLVITW